MNNVLLNAAAGGGSSAQGILMMVLYVAAFGALLYLIMIRPQKKEQNRMKELLSSLEVGDSVLTSSGFYGVIIDISDDTVIVEFGNNKNCRIPMKKEAITQIEKAESAASSSDEKKDK